MPDRVPERMLDRMPDRMPENIKCGNEHWTLIVVVANKKQEGGERKEATN